MCLSINSGLNVNNLRLRHEWAMFSREVSSLTQDQEGKYCASSSLHELALPLFLGMFFPL